ncbi:uncharacterized protein VTP21DRAFT_4865 [Calcarisporiella thermophila]|uniref:uncharacterized protein n=1 Tax=Calcarisporiella thermophila TaxID=911321 RepID=UPI00374325BC
MAIRRIDNTESLLGDPEARRMEAFNLKQGIRAFLYSSRLNLGLVFVPLGLLAQVLHWPASAVFTLNFLAIIPLAKLLGYATEDVSLRVGHALGGLLNATFGNAVELIISIFALKRGMIHVVQASMLGSILSNLLFVLGLSFFLGGLRYPEQMFNQTAAQTSASMMALSTSSLLLPAAFRYSVVGEKPVDMEHQILGISHASAVLLLAIYVGYLIFQLRTHTQFFESEEDHSEETPEMSLSFGILALFLVTTLIALCAEGLVGAIEGTVESWNISSTFVGLILLPIVGNAGEHISAVTFALKDKVDLTIGIALGSSLQIALFVTPLMVIIGWIIGQPMTLCFDLFSTAVLLISVLVTNYIINDGASNWLEGAQLLVAYFIIAISYFYYPDVEN